jgi:DNA-binding CsgD family transcriptional regulator
MPARAYEQLRLLTGNHVREPLTARQQQVWAALAVGLSDGEIAQEFTITAATVRSHVVALERAIFDGADIVPSRALLVVEFWLHTSCCTAHLLQTIKTA